MRTPFAVLLVLITIAGPAFAQDMPLSQVLVEGEGWQLVSSGHKFTEGPASDAAGNVYFTDVPENKIWRIDAKTGKPSVFVADAARPSGMMFDAQGRLIANRGAEKRIVAYKPDGSFDVIAEGVNCNDLAVARNGDIYVTDRPNKSVVRIDAKGEKQAVAQGWLPNGVLLWPDGGTLVVTDSNGPHLWTLRVEPDGTLTQRDRWYSPLVVPPGRDRPGSDGMTMDADGRLYLASYAGLQVFDTLGRPSGVIAKPQRAFLSNVVFGGADHNYLYVTCTDKVYRRKTKVNGVVLH